MSEERDIARDRAAARLLGQLPAPRVPADLAARIVREVSRLPQESAEPEIARVPPIETPAAPARRRRWWPLAVGGAIAASAIGLLLMHPQARPAPALVAASPVAAAPDRSGAEVAVADPDPHTRPAVVREAPKPARKPAAPEPSPPSLPGSRAAADLVAPGDLRPDVAPAPVEAPAKTPVEQAVAGPQAPGTGTGIVIGPMLPGPPAGLGIAGSGGPVSDTAPSPPSDMPRGPSF